MFLAPAYFIAALAVAGGVLALHLIVLRQPPRAQLPTTRFIPVRPAVVRALSHRPEDILLLLLRAATVILIGAAFAEPTLLSHRRVVLPIIIIDRSRAVADEHEVADSARALISNDGQGIIILVDSAPRMIDTHIADSLASLALVHVRGSLSSGLVSALQAASSHRDIADSFTLSIVSPHLADEIDAATDSIVRLWPGSIHWIAVRPADRLTRWGSQNPTIAWPPDGRAPGTRARPVIDTVGAVVAGDIVMVAQFERRWRLDPSGARVIARWVDGEPAAIERASHGLECEHDVSIPISNVGDVAIRPEFEQLRGLMAAPCGADIDEVGQTGVAPVNAIDTGARASVPARLIVRAEQAPINSPRWLLAMALCLLVIEMFVRRRA